MAELRISVGMRLERLAFQRLAAHITIPFQELANKRSRHENSTFADQIRNLFAREVRPASAQLRVASGMIFEYVHQELIEFGRQFGLLPAPFFRVVGSSISCELSRSANPRRMVF